jgi:hypothetical protein
MTRKDTPKKHRRKPRSEETKEKIRQALLERGRLVREGFLPAFRHSEKTKKLLRKLAKGRKPSRKAVFASVAARKDRKAAKIAARMKFT